MSMFLISLIQSKFLNMSPPSSGSNRPSKIPEWNNVASCFSEMLAAFQQTTWGYSQNMAYEGCTLRNFLTIFGACYILRVKYL
jgi:hypothetical protein